MHIEYTISERDYLAAVNLFWRSRRGAMLRLYVLPVACLLGVLPFACTAILLHDRLSLAFVPLIVLLAGPAASRMRSRRRIARSYRENIALHSRSFVDLDDRGDRLRDVVTDHFTPWHEFSGYVENSTTFLRILGATGRFYITPKRELSAAQIVEFRSLLESHLPQGSVGSGRKSAARSAQPSGSGAFA